MSKRILLIVGHPDPDAARLCRALARAYADGAREVGHEVREIDIARIDFPMLRTAQDFEHGSMPASLAEAAASVQWCEHIVFVFPLWLGTMPALLKAFLEQVMRPGIAFDRSDGGAGFTKAGLKGRSARIVVSMGMPSTLYRLWFLDHGIAGMRRSILHLVGIRPVRQTLFGLAGANEKSRARWLAKLNALGRRGS